MIKPIEIMFFHNGNTAAFDKKGQQIPELQVSWLIKYVEFLESKNINPLDIKFLMPNGKYAKLFEIDKKYRTDQKYNWQFMEESGNDK